MISTSTTTSKPALLSPRPRFPFRRLALLTLGEDSDAQVLRLAGRAVYLGADSLLLRSPDLTQEPEADLAIKRQALAALRGALPKLWLSVEVQIAPQDLPADGIHLKAATDIHKPEGDTRLWTKACHSPADIIAAAAAKLDAVTYSPIFPTRTHPEARALGVEHLQAVAADSPLPIIALGGLWPNNASACFEAGAVAIAGIACFRDR